MVETKDSEDDSDNNSAANIASELAIATKKKRSGPPQWAPDKNHGRYGVSDYSGCDTVHYDFEDLHPGSACPDCSALNTPGRLHAYPAGNLIRLTGHPVISGVNHNYTRLRCNVCLKVFSAQVPAAVRQRAKYDASCRSALAINRFGMGMPFHRIEHYQRYHGVPVADATMYDLMNELVDVCFPVYCALQRHGAEGDLNQYDDTNNRILELVSHPLIKSRKGAHTTTMVIRCDEATVVLFKTSQQIARENVKDLYEYRTCNESFMTMTDASSQNLPSNLSESLLYTHDH